MPFSVPVIRTSVLLLCSLLLLSACKTEMYSGLNQREANRMSAVLLQKGIPVEREVTKDGSVTLMVEEDRFAEAVAVLDDAGLPGQSFSNLGEVFQSNGLVSSPVQERAQLIYALSEELSHTVSEVDGVLDARVHVVLPDNDLLKRKVSPSSASVFIRVHPGLDVAALTPKIKTLVASSISGLAYDRVSVVSVEAEASSGARGPALESFMGIWMLPSSKSHLMAVLGGLLAVLAAAAIAGGYLYWRRRQPAHYRVSSAADTSGEQQV